jgi:cytochrome oxidase assembly protein ShyY1
MMISITVKHYRFSCKPLALSVVTLLSLLFISLGHWQLKRAQFKRDLQQDFNSRSIAKPLTLAQISDTDNLHFRPLIVKGKFDNQHIILLDNQFYRHQLGYYVLTLFIPDNNKRLLLVNRGWIAAPSERKAIPAIPAVNGEYDLQGTIKIPDKIKFKLSRQAEDFAQSDRQILRIETLEISNLEQYIGKPLYPFIMLLNAGQTGSFTCDWQPVELKPYIHTGYALQWFAFAITLLAAFVITHTKVITDDKY